MFYFNAYHAIFFSFSFISKIDRVICTLNIVVLKHEDECFIFTFLSHLIRRILEYRKQRFHSSSDVSYNSTLFVVQTSNSII